MWTELRIGSNVARVIGDLTRMIRLMCHCLFTTSKDHHARTMALVFVGRYSSNRRQQYTLSIVYSSGTVGGREGERAITTVAVGVWLRQEQVLYLNENDGDDDRIAAMM